VIAGERRYRDLLRDIGAWGRILRRS
jgi:hypothetical protein